ncbi:ABC transporter [Escherichia coli]|nr:ABC transporter [Escherichia coli]HAL7179622.1 ABC transporter [Escherichia coli]HAX7961254.1 ABC transporter [Escherichia coli]HCN1110212.1 ABC transporter [Escherichia coli]HCN1115270.1 ABC transporter [Escherichia coli]
MKSIKCIFIILISAFPVCCLSDTWYGVLRGNKIIDFRSPTTGIIEIDTAENGKIDESKYVFNIEDIESPIKKEILSKKRNSLIWKKKDTASKLENATLAYRLGFVPKNKLNEYYQNLNNIEIELEELESQYKSLEYLDLVKKPFIKEKYIYRNIYVNNNAFVNVGDNIMKIETIDKFHVDIKFDPVMSNFKGKKIKYRSLVSGLTGEAKLINITGNLSGEVKNGLKTAVLQIDDGNRVSHELLDTAFEISIDD